LPETAADRLMNFRRRREEAAKSPQGFLSLVNTQWVTEATTVWAAKGTWAPRPDGGSGLVVTATADEGVMVDGELVDGEAIARGKDDDNPSTIVFSETSTGTVISGNEGYALRVFDQNSDDNQNFSHVDGYPYNPEMLFVAGWEEIPGGSLVGFEHLKDDGEARDEVVPGTIVLEYGGETYRLSAFKAGKALQLVFADATSGVDTYSVGRFLFCAPNPDGTITLDFNYAVLPPCAFSYQYNCPLPPANNRLPFAIEAGEKMVMAANGPLHPE
jgi:uncharacterized protein (DUF1684 family)